jgi:hypothetical protein
VFTAFCLLEPLKAGQGGMQQTLVPKTE